MTAGVHIEQRDGVRIVHMRFGRANAMNRGMLDALGGALDDGDPQPTVLTGEGKVFCAGLDLVQLDRYEREEFETFLTRFSRTMIQVLTTPYPLVAAVNGHAVAGGCVLALACDYRVGAKGDYKVGMNELALGLPLPAAANEIPRGALNPHTYRTVVMSGVLMPPETAQQVGIFDMLCDDAETAVEQACALAREQGKSPAAFAGVKAGVVAPVVNAIRELREPLDRRFIDIWFSEPTSAARRATVEKLTKKD
jgi:enoyl-CoA hydratase